jgi:lipid-A-disaccharide synthase-like uncharacterized protein
MDNHRILIYGVGLTAQVLFSARILVQWISSEKAGKVLSPTSFWTTSLLASALLMVYGALRVDIVIIGGQLVSYFIYMRNISLKQMWHQINSYIRWFAILFPILAIAWLCVGLEYSFKYIIEHSRISGALIAWGGLGQMVFTLRFVYQWYYSERAQKSVLPLGFWVLSLLGSLLIISYALLRLDPILLLGQVFGVFAYSRNFYLGLQEQTAARRSSSIN